MTTPVLIISGFLGCGKTSFLRHLLPLCGEVGVRPALIINEVGDADVDGELLADLHAEQARLVGGCVCCTLQAQLAQTVDGILEQERYNLLIIECSGLSNPIDVLSALTSPALVRRLAVTHIVTLVDGRRAEAMLKVTELAKTQVSSADVLIFNKEDLLAPDRRAGIEALAASLNDHAERHWATYGDIGTDTLRRLLTDPAPVRAVHVCDTACDHGHHHHHDHALPASFNTFAVPLPPRVPRAAMERLLDTMPETVIRAKGFANLDDDGWHVMHRVYDAWDITPFIGATPSNGALLVCIGQHLDRDALEAHLTDCGVVVPA
jgi:G3E family GTPase